MIYISLQRLPTALIFSETRSDILRHIGEPVLLAQITGQCEVNFLPLIERSYDTSLLEIFRSFTAFPPKILFLICFGRGERSISFAA